jgi:DNA polymerase
MREMQENAPTLPPIRAERILERLPARQGLGELNACARCPIGAKATQAVGGVGPRDAPLMIVGEQPGDREDLEGVPFVGPAGQLFDQLATEAGLDHTAAYVTNAVKHFKFTPRGKRRIHQSPHKSEVDACRVWLEQEIAQVQPAFLLALGATAAQTLTGDGGALMQRRGRVERGREGLPVLITLHPSAVLRGEDQDALRALMVQDLRLAAKMVKDVNAL